VTRTERTKLKTKLQGLASRIKGDVATSSAEALRAQGGEASGSLSNTPLHLADLATDLYDQELSLSVLETKSQTLAEVTEALARVDQKNFGYCERCNKEIAPKRLEAVPYARYCIQCAQVVEQEENRRI